jgi:hypothetical protein
MRKSLAGIVTLASVIAFPLRLSAQQPPQAPSPAPGGVIAGILTSGDLGQPVRKAPVRLVTVATRQSRPTATDADGRFLFSNLPPGAYTLVASKPGFLEMVYGARRPGPTSPGTVITLAAGQKIDTIAMRLPRGSVISGTIIDEFGDPAFNVPVRAMRNVFQEGYRALGGGGNAVTDDRGVYRIAGLAPGDYLVSAVPRDTVSAAAATAEALRDRQAQITAAAKAGGDVPPFLGATPPALGSTGYVPVYFPGTASGASSAAVTVGPSLEVSGIDMRLQVMQTASVSGAISSAEGVIPQSRLQLIDRSMPLNGVGIWFRDMRADGSFSFHGLVPGPYLLKAFGTPGGKPGMAGGEMWGSTEITVDARGVSDVNLRMQRGVTVTGSVALDDVPPAVDRTRLRVVLYPISSPTDWEMGSVAAPLDEAGKFSASNVLPALYRLSVTGLPAGWLVDSATFEAKDAADFHLPIDGSRNMAGVELKVTSRRSELSGVVANASGAPVPDYTVILFPTDRRLWVPQSRRIHFSQPGADGRYTFRGLPPGEYRLAALADPEPGRLADPEFLAQLVSAGIVIQLGDGEKRAQDVRVR